MGPSRGLLRFLTCGSVDDGKSTLIGRLLHDAKVILDDQLSAAAEASRRRSSMGDDLDFSLLLDGLEAEREQGITIDVAHRYFTTAKRSFVVLDSPGHEQYTRNMVTGASRADLAVLLVDARSGVVTQTRRHSFICSLLGVRHVILAVNKIDLVDYKRDAFDRVVDDYKAFASRLRFMTIEAIPTSAKLGDNVVDRSCNTAWYGGPCLLDCLEEAEVNDGALHAPLRFPVQWVNRAYSDFRGYAGTVASGVLRPGDPIMVAGSRQATTIKSLVTADGLLPSAGAGEAVTITLNDEIDVTRGDILAHPTQLPAVSNQFSAQIIWMSERALFPGRSYLLRIGNRTVPGTITSIDYKVDINSWGHLVAKQLNTNEVGFCNVAVLEPVAFDFFDQNRKTGAFIVIDRSTNETVGAGLITPSLRQASNVNWQQTRVERNDRAAQKRQVPAVVWLTGLSGAGKSTIANLVEQQLQAANYHTMLLDGDNLRHGLNRDLGFTEADRVENIRRAGEVAKLMFEAGLVVLCSFISPYLAERNMVRVLFSKGAFIEVFVDTPLDECVRRDPKGLYARAIRGEITNFTGLDAPYEIPQDPEIHVKTIGYTPAQVALEVLRRLTDFKIIEAASNR